MSAVLSVAACQLAVLASLLKPDRPRAIDRYIDYFGDARRAAPPAALVSTRLRRARADR